MGVLDVFMTAVVDLECEHFLLPHGWSTEALRAVLLALLLNAPTSHLRRMTAAADGQITWLDEFERDPLGGIRGYSLIPTVTPRAAALRREALEGAA